MYKTPMSWYKPFKKSRIWNFKLCFYFRLRTKQNKKNKKKNVIYIKKISEVDRLETINPYLFGPKDEL